VKYKRKTPTTLTKSSKKTENYKFRFNKTTEQLTIINTNNYQERERKREREKRERWALIQIDNVTLFVFIAGKRDILLGCDCSYHENEKEIKSQQFNVRSYRSTSKQIQTQSECDQEMHRHSHRKRVFGTSRRTERSVFVYCITFLTQWFWGRSLRTHISWHKHFFIFSLISLSTHILLLILYLLINGDNNNNIAIVLVLLLLWK
jgi:hypothetical protein